MKRSALLCWGMVCFDAAVPPASFPFRKIWRELDRKPTISVILLLKPHTVPHLTDERACLESPIFPSIVTIALLIECQAIDGVAIYIFPFTGEDMEVPGLSSHRWRKGIRRNILMPRRDGASCCEQCTGEKERSCTPCQPPLFETRL